MFRTFRLLPLSPALLLLALPLVGCADDDPNSKARLAETGLALTLDLGSQADVAAIGYAITPVDCGSGEPTGETIFDQSPIEEETIPGGLPSLEGQGLDPDSVHHFADLFTVLPAGCYDVEVTPLTVDGSPSAVCAAARSSGVEVDAGMTTEIVLISQCTGLDNGALDVIATLNDEPALEVYFEQSKFVCVDEEQVVCATAVDPNGDLLELEWSFDDGVSSPVLVSSEHDAEAHSLTECVRVTAGSAGKFDVRVVAYDLLMEAGELVRIEDWLATRSDGAESHAALDFFFYATECAPTGCEPSLRGIGANTQLEALSADGSTATGFHWEGATSQAQRFDATGLQDLGGPSPLKYTRGQGVSADGSVIGGYGYGSLGPEALRWQQDTGWTGLGVLAGGTFSYGLDLSATGDVVVGYADSSGVALPFRWEAGTGMIGLGLTGGNTGGSAYATDSDGGVVVGDLWGPSSTTPFRWTQATGLVLFATSGTHAHAEAVSGDGAVSGGCVYSGSRWSAALWTAAGEVVLEDLPGATFGTVNALSSDGSVAVGTAGGSESIAVVWDASDGVRAVRDILADAGVDVSDWDLYDTTGISADGKIVAGRAHRNSSGATEGFIACLP
jgi:uncharacterized membrane protein